MSDPYGDPLPPGHGEGHDEWVNEDVPVCPICGGGLRSTVLASTSWDAPTRTALRCDLHGEVMPEWIKVEDDEDI